MSRYSPRLSWYIAFFNEAFPTRCVLELCARLGMRLLGPAPFWCRGWPVSCDHRAALSTSKGNGNSHRNGSRGLCCHKPRTCPCLDTDSCHGQQLHLSTWRRDPNGQASSSIDLGWVEVGDVMLHIHSGCPDDGKVGDWDSCHREARIAGRYVNYFTGSERPEPAIHVRIFPLHIDMQRMVFEIGKDFPSHEWVVVTHHRCASNQSISNYGCCILCNSRQRMSTNHVSMVHWAGGVPC